MARKLIDQDEAARILGVTPEEIGSLRDRKKLFPYRDGDQWKYKPEDIEQIREEMAEGKAASESGAGQSWISANVAAEQAEPGTPQAGESWAGSALDDVELEVNEELDSILLSEIELGKSGEGPSTIIGKRSTPDDDADVLPAAEQKPGTTPAAEISDLKLADSNVSLGAGPGSDVRLVATGSDATHKPTGPGSTGNLFGSDALSLSDDELSLIGSSPAVIPEPKETESGSKVPGPGSSLKLEDEDFVIGGKGSDVTLSPTDSGIQLISAADSGLSLEQPLEVGSSAKELLDLGEADVVSLEDQTVTETPAEAKADEEFLLSALDESTEESDSGSQVIALDTDDVSSGMFAPLTSGAPMLEEEPAAVPLSGAPLLAPTPTATPAQIAASPVVAEPPFSTGNVIALVCCAVILLLCGMMTYDLMRNMWSWDGPYAINSSIMDSLGNTIGWFDK